MQYVNAFWVGGLICVAGQILIDKTKLTPARILTGFVVAGVILGAIGLYKPLVDFAGAGASVPISGFGFLMSEGVRKALSQDGALGILTGGLTSAAAGISAAIVFGLIAALILQLFYNFILSKIEHITSQMEESAISMLDIILKYKNDRANV